MTLKNDNDPLEFIENDSIIILSVCKWESPNQRRFLSVPNPNKGLMFQISSYGIDALLQNV